MNGDDKQKIAADDMSFKLYVVENLGGIKADVDHLKRQNENQFNRIQSLEAGPRRAMIASGGITAVILGVIEGIKQVLRQ